MDLLCITDASKKFDVSSKTLRYYENVGILKSIRMEDNKYRYYDNEAVERIKQILILRKMQISIKNIVRIYENEDMRTVVEVFVDRINAIDEQVGALSELKNIINEFLQTMIHKGITKISALPLLYEEMDKQLTVLEERKPISYERLSSVSEKLTKMPEIRIVSLPAMRMITSNNKKGESLIDDFWSWVHMNGITPGNPGAHKQFEYQDEKNQSVIMLAIPEDYKNKSDFCDKIFNGGMFAVASVYADEDIEAFHKVMARYFDGNLFYEIDYSHIGKQRHETLIETIISPDSTRELLDIFIPIKRRIPEVKNFDKIASVQILANITIDEIERANPVLWKHKIMLDKLLPIYKQGYESVHHEFLPNGSLYFNPYVSTRYLSTDISVRLPFRFDIDCITKDKTNQNDMLRIRYDGNDYTINEIKSGRMEFMQPIFKDWHKHNEAGRINTSEYNRISWIIGEKHLALIINNEIQYCGVNFPYMLSDFGLLPEYPIFIGSNGNALTIRSVTVSQLKYTPKVRVKKENFNMVTKQSNNTIPNIRVICRGDRGENHAFPGVAAYVMECIGDTTIGNFTGDFNERLWFFEGLTADIFAQVFSYVGYQGWARSDYLYSKEFITEMFYKCGYASTFISPEEFNSNNEMYLQTVMAYIDKGVPVIARKLPHDECVPIIGYEDYGKTLLYPDISNTKEIHKLTVEGDLNYSWIFVGEKKRDINIAEVYRDMIYDLPEILEQQTERYCFGVNAFMDWANEVESKGFFAWDVYHINYLTAGACSGNVFKKVVEFNPDMEWVNDIHKLHNKSGLWEESDSGEQAQKNNADPDKRAWMASFIKKNGQDMAEIIKIIRANRKTTKII